MGAEQARPWWASDDAGVDRLASDEDPLTAHRTARRSAPPDGEQGPEPDQDAPLAGELHDASTCGLCPICTGLRLLGEHRPDVLDHLNEASRHLTAAFRRLLEPVADPRRDDRNPRTSLDPFDRNPGTSPDSFERIEVDGPDLGGGPPRTAGGTAVDDRGPGTWPL